MGTADTNGAHRAGWAATLSRLALVATLIVLLNLTLSWGLERLELQFWPSYADMADRALVIGLILYIGLMALPFVPGIEIGLAIMMILGGRGVLLVYLCTVVALALAFGLGRLCPARVLGAVLGWLHLKRAAALVLELDATAPEARLELLTAKSPTRIVPALLRRRYILLALLLNLPGNFLIGGAGGIALMAGMSRLFPFSRYLMLIAVAILPGPVLILLSDMLA